MNAADAARQLGLRIRRPLLTARHDGLPSAPGELPSAAAVRQAFAKAVQTHHPSRHSGADEATRASHASALRKAQAAYAALWDAVHQRSTAMSPRSREAAGVRSPGRAPSPSVVAASVAHGSPGATSPAPAPVSADDAALPPVRMRRQPSVASLRVRPAGAGTPDAITLTARVSPAWLMLLGAWAHPLLLAIGRRSWGSVALQVAGLWFVGRRFGDRVDASPAHVSVFVVSLGIVLLECACAESMLLTGLALAGAISVHSLADTLACFSSYGELGALFVPALVTTTALGCTVARHATQLLWVVWPIVGPWADRVAVAIGVVAPFVVDSILSRDTEAATREQEDRRQGRDSGRPSGERRDQVRSRSGRISRTRANSGEGNSALSESEEVDRADTEPSGDASGVVGPYIMCVLCGIVFAMSFWELQLRDAAWVALLYLSYVEMVVGVLFLGARRVKRAGRAWRVGAPASLLRDGKDEEGGRSPRSRLHSCVRRLCCCCRCCLSTPRIVAQAVSFVALAVAVGAAASCFVFVFALLTTWSAEGYWDTVVLVVAIPADIAVLAIIRRWSLRWRTSAMCDAEDVVRYGARMKSAWHAALPTWVSTASIVAHLAAILAPAATVVLAISWAMVFAALS